MQAQESSVLLLNPLTVRFRPPWEILSSSTFTVEEVRPTYDEAEREKVEVSTPSVEMLIEPFGIGWRHTEDEDLRWLLETVLAVPPPSPLRGDATPPQRLAYAFRARQPVEEKMKAALARVRFAPFVAPDISTPQRRGMFKESREREKPWEARHVVGMGYVVDGFETLAWLEFIWAVERGLVVKRCPCCEGVFVPVPGNARYCAACRKDSTHQQLYYHRKKRQMDEVKKEERRAYWREKKREERKRKAEEVYVAPGGEV